MGHIRSEQTAGSGRKADAVALRDKLTGELIGLARATDGNEHLINDSATAVIVEGLLATAPNGNMDDARLQELLARVEAEKRNMVPDCFACVSPCGKNNAYDMENMWTAEERIRVLKTRILLAIREMAALACRDESVNRFFYRALTAIGIDAWEAEDLMVIVEEAEAMKGKYIG